MFKEVFSTYTMALPKSICQLYSIHYLFVSCSDKTRKFVGSLSVIQSWTFSGPMVSVTCALGIHLECSNWVFCKIISRGYFPPFLIENMLKSVRASLHQELSLKPTMKWTNASMYFKLFKYIKRPKRSLVEEVLNFFYNIV